MLSSNREYNLVVVIDIRINYRPARPRPERFELGCMGGAHQLCADHPRCVCKSRLRACPATVTGGLQWPAGWPVFPFGIHRRATWIPRHHRKESAVYLHAGSQANRCS